MSLSTCPEGDRAKKVVNLMMVIITVLLNALYRGSKATTRSFTMAALCNRTGHYIFILWFLLLSSSFFPRLISAVGDWMSAIRPHMVWP